MATFDFTESERHEIDTIYKLIGNGETLTTEQANLYARFEAYKAVRNQENQAEIERITLEAQTNVTNSNLLAQTALSNMNELHSAAMARYENSLSLINGTSI